jgi:hypothetical protein
MMMMMMSGVPWIRDARALDGWMDGWMDGSLDGDGDGDGDGSIDGLECRERERG